MYAHLCKGYVHANVHLRLASLRRHYPDQVHGYDLSLGIPWHPCSIFSVPRNVLSTSWLDKYPAFLAMQDTSATI